MKYCYLLILVVVFCVALWYVDAWPAKVFTGGEGGKSGGIEEGPRSEDLDIRTVAASDEDLAKHYCSLSASELEAVLPRDGQLFGHTRSVQSNADELVAVPPMFNGGNCGQVHKDVLPALREMLLFLKDDAPEIHGLIMGISCYRSIDRQKNIFCNKEKIDKRGYAEQAKWIAPPGYSEHATGRAIDFGNKEGECNLDACFEDDPVGKWLLQNAKKFGFKMSFYPGNEAGIAYEPWHYVYVGI